MKMTDWCSAVLPLSLVLVYVCHAVTPQDALPNPRITEHPKDGYLSINDPETLDCNAEGIPKPKIMWYRNGKRVITYPDDPTSQRIILEDRKLFFLSVTHSKKDSDVGVYYCNATNIHGSAISRNATLKLAFLKEDFHVSPQDQTVASGESVTFHCEPPQGGPDPIVSWRKGAEPIHIASNNNRFQIKPNGDLVITSTRKKDAGDYKCMASSNKAGDVESSPATLTILEKPSFRRLPVDLITQEEKTVEIPCDVIGDPPLNVQWKRERGSLKFGRMRMLPDHTLRMERVEPGDAGTYICVATNSVGTTEAVATLVVEYRPVFEVKPEDTYVAVGRTATLPCAVIGNPVPDVYWSKKAPRNPTKNSLMFPNFVGGRLSVTSDGTLRIINVEMADAGDYECEALNTLGIVTARVTLEVRANDPRPPPIIKIGPQNQTLPTSEVGFLRCEAVGTPLPRIQWFKDGYAIMNDARKKKLDSGTLQLNELRESDSGTYTCKATSETGETSWSAVLQVKEPSPHHQGSSYHRAPDASSFPGPPSIPLVSDVTDRSVHLSWQPSSNHGDSPVYSFMVEYFSYETMGGWMVASNSVQQESYTVNGLKPDTSYIFIVRSKNSHGLGPPSEHSTPVRTSVMTPKGQGVGHVDQDDEDLQGIVVQIIKGEAMNATSLYVVWSVEKAYSLIDRFEIHYTELIDMQKNIRGKKYAQSVGPGYRQFTLTKLQGYMWYEVCVMAYSHDVHSQCSSPMKIQTLDSRPEAPPDNIIMHKSTDTTMFIQWSPPPRVSRNGVIQGYEIYCLSDNKRHNCSSRTNGTANTLTIQGLDPATTYTVMIAARNRKGVGVYSKAFLVGPEPPNIMKEPWFIGMLIGTIGGTVWIAVCIFTIWICRKRKNKKKMLQNGLYSMPTFKPEDTRTCTNSFHRNGYGAKDVNTSTGIGGLSPEVSNLLDKDMELQDQNIYNVPQMKTFYQKKDPVAPYATTTLINAGNAAGRPVNGGMEHVFRPITQNSSGSGDSCCKHDRGRSDSNVDNCQPNTGTGHENCDALQSPTSDSGSHTTDENGCLIKQGGKPLAKAMQQKQSMVNWAEFLPPPPVLPPPNEVQRLNRCCDQGNNLDYAEVNSERAGGARSPMSPVSKMSSCSCPAPQNGVGVGNWNVPAYSDSGCARCSSPKYCESWHNNPQLYNVIRTQSPRGNENLGQRTIGCAHPTRSAPIDVQCGSRSCHSDQEQGSLPPLQSYRISQPPYAGEGECLQCRSDSDRSSSGGHHSNPRMCKSIHASDGGPCLDQGCQSSLPSVANECLHSSMYPARLEMSESGQHLNIAVDGYHRHGDSPTSEIAPEYVGESSDPEADPPMEPPPGFRRTLEEPNDFEDENRRSGSMLASWASVTDQSNTDCSSVRSSVASSGDGSFLNEANFANAVAKAAEKSGLSVVGTTVSDPSTGQQGKRQRRHHRPRPTSPYSTDSNYGSVVHKPYPKSQRKKQLSEQGKKSRRNPENSPMTEQNNYKGTQEVSGVQSYNKTSFPSSAPPLRSAQPIKSLSPSFTLNVHQNPNAYKFENLILESNVPVV